MNFKKQIFILAFGCFFLFLLQSCNKDNVNSPSIEKEDPYAVPADTRTACFAMMQEISWANGDDCAQNSADLLEDAFDALSGNVNDSTIANVMIHQIGYFIHLVNCDSSYECYNCDEYLALAYAFADCLESEGSAYAGWLDNTIVTLENACNQCDDPECCDSVSLTVTSVPHPSQEGCCEVTVGLNDPNGCTDGNGTAYYANGGQVSVAYPLRITHCPDFGPVQFLLNDCYASATPDDCEEKDCCDDIQINVTQTPGDGNCCTIRFDFSGCTDGFQFQVKGHPAIPISGNFYEANVCSSFSKVRVFHKDCNVASGWIRKDC